MSYKASITKNLRARLTLLFIIVQMLCLVVAYVSAVGLAQYFNLSKGWQLPLGFLIYSIFTIIVVVAIIYISLRTLSQVENYFDAVQAKATVSDSALTSRTSKALVKTILGETGSIPSRVSKLQARQLPDNSNYIFNHLPAGILALDADNSPVAANDTIYELLGASKGQFQELSQQLAQVHFTHQLNLAGWIAKCQKDKIHDTFIWDRVELKLVEDEQMVTHMFDVVATYNKGEPRGLEVVLVFIDRTSDYTSDDTAMDFIAIAAHELRGPITVMRGLIDIFNTELATKIDTDQKELLRKMEVSSKQLANYITNILNVAHIDRDSFETTLRQEEWAPIITQIVEEMNDQAEARGRHLSVSIPTDLPPVAADRVGIEHVMMNLIDNAIKYSPEGGNIEVTSRFVEDTVETTVQDNGIGIPESVMGHLFTKFYRSHRSKKAISGSGLGLYLCKIIINAHDGDIWVRSQEGKGTTVGFTIPIYDKVADRVKASDNDNGITRGTHGWIKNHSLYRR